MDATTKADAMAALGFTTDVDLALELGISKQAAGKYVGGRPLPFVHRWTLWQRYPTKFPVPAPAARKHRAS